MTKGRSLAVAISNAEAQIKNIQRSVSVASDNLENHVTLFQKKLHDKQEEARNSLHKQEDVFTNWEKSVRIAASIPVHPGFLSLAQRPPSNPRVPSMLTDLINVGELKKAAAASELRAQDFVTDMEKLSSKVGEIVKKTANLRDDIQQNSVGSSGNYQSEEPQNILEDMEAVTRKMRAGMSLALSNYIHYIYIYIYPDQFFIRL